MKTNPKLPDMSIDWIAVNPADDGKLFADETARIDITVSNWGRRPTVTNSWMKLHLWAQCGSTTNYLFRWLNFDKDSIFKIFEKDESQTYTFYTTFPEGSADLKAEVRYYEVENSYWEYGAMQYDTVYADENSNAYSTIITGTVDITTLDDGDYHLCVKTQDATGNRTASAMLPFTLDTTAPSPVLSIDDGAAVTSDDIVKLTVTLSGNEPGPLTVQFSNDGSDWATPINWFPDSPLEIETWKLTGEGYEELTGTATVYVQVSDTLEHSTVTSDSISVNAIGALSLAGGSVFWPSNTVPFTLNLPPGEEQTLWSEPDPFCEGHLLDLGYQLQYAAQKVVLTSPVLITYVKLKFATPAFAGNCSRRVLRKLILDREDPVFRHLYLRGQNAPGYTDNKFFYINFFAWDAFPYPLMEMRYRINSDSWSGWTKIYRKPYEILIDGSVYPASTFYVDMEVRDEAGNTIISCTSIPFRRPPDQPSGIMPTGVCYYKSQVLSASAFSDPDSSDYMRYSWWRVRNADGSVVYDSGPLGTGTQHLLNAPLDFDNPYTWEVQYTDKNWISSPWSEGMEFTIDSTDLDGDGMPDGWETLHLGGTNYMANQDFDGDGALNGEEFEAGTSASDSNSALRITGADCTGQTPHQIIFTSVPGAVYALDFRTNLSDNVWTQQLIKAAAFPGSSTMVENTVNSNCMQRGFYRIRLQDGP